MKQRVAIVTLLLLAVACGGPSKSSETSDQPSVSTQKPAATPDPSLPKRVDPVPLNCAAKGVQAEYSAQTQSMPPTVDLIYRGSRPTSKVAERTLRNCLQHVADTKLVGTEVMGTVWHSKSGKEDDDETVALPDGSSHLVYQPASKRIITWKEREGVPADTVETNTAGGYFVVSETNKVLVAPGGTYIHLSVVFQKEPTEKHAFEVLTAELRKAVTKQTSRVPTTSSAFVGPPNDPAARQALKGSNGRYMSVDFDPNRPDFLTTSAGTQESLQ